MLRALIYCTRVRAAHAQINDNAVLYKKPRYRHTLIDRPDRPACVRLTGGSEQLARTSCCCCCCCGLVKMLIMSEIIPSGSFQPFIVWPLPKVPTPTGFRRVQIVGEIVGGEGQLLPNSCAWQTDMRFGRFCGSSAQTGP